MHGITSVAVSLEWDEHADYDRAAAIAGDVLAGLLARRPPPGSLYNVNIPTKALRGAAELRVVPLSVSRYGEAFERRANVRRGWLAVVDIEHRRLDDDQPSFGGIVGKAFRNLADQIDAAALPRRIVQRRQRLAFVRTSECFRGIDPLALDRAAMMAGANRDETPVEVQAIGGFVEQAEESSADVAETDKSQGNLRIAHRGCAASLATT